MPGAKDRRGRSYSGPFSCHYVRITVEAGLPIRGLRWWRLGVFNPARVEKHSEKSFKSKGLSDVYYAMGEPLESFEE